MIIIAHTYVPCYTCDMKTRMLITGASGFIGRNLFEYFSKKEGLEVFGAHKSRPLLPQDHAYEADLTREDVARNLLTEVKPQILIHAAASTAGFREFKKSEGAFIHANVLMNMHLIALAAEYHVSRVVLLSCSLVYPAVDSVVTEEDVASFPPAHPYSGGAKVKSVMEDFARHYTQVSNGQTIYTIVRHSNIYGPYDKFHDGGHLVSSKIAEIAGAKDNGTIVVRGHGTERRDLLHVDDLVRFIDMALGRQQLGTDVWNVGYGVTFPVNEIVQKIVDVSGKRLMLTNDFTIQSAPTQPALNCQKAKNALGWTPNIKLDDGIRMTMEWYKANKHLL